MRRPPKSPLFPYTPLSRSRAPDDPPRSHPAELQAGAAPIRDPPIREREAVYGGIDAELRFVARAQDLDVDPLANPERTEQALAVRGVAHGRRRDGDDARPTTPGGISLEEV